MRKKYSLTEDISSQLLRDFGDFKFTPHHTNERVALQNGEIIKKKNGKVTSMKNWPIMN